MEWWSGWTKSGGIIIGQLRKKDICWWFLFVQRKYIAGVFCGGGEDEMEERIFAWAECKESSDFPAKKPPIIWVEKTQRRNMTFGKTVPRKAILSASKFDGSTGV